MQVAGIEIVGKSVSGYATAITLPHFGLTFDCGAPTSAALKTQTVLITHGHMDHFGAVANHANVRGMIGAPPTRFIVPEVLRDRVAEVMDFWAQVQNEQSAPFTVDVLVPGDRLELGSKRFARSFATPHRVPSQGYVVCEERKSLKAEFQGLPGKELGRLRGTGVAIEDVAETPLVAFTGDTRASLFDDPDLLALRAKVLITECTFLPGVEIEEAERKGHVHLEQLVQLAHDGRFDEVEALVLLHFSARYGNPEVEEALKLFPASVREKVCYLPVEGAD